MPNYSRIGTPLQSTSYQISISGSAHSDSPSDSPSTGYPCPDFFLLFLCFFVFVVPEKFWDCGWRGAFGCRPLCGCSSRIRNASALAKILSWHSLRNAWGHDVLYNHPNSVLKLTQSQTVNQILNQRYPTDKKRHEMRLPRGYVDFRLFFRP